MQPTLTRLSSIDDDPVVRLVLSGQAQTLDEAEEMYLDASMAEVLQLIGNKLADEQLSNHPLLALLRAHGSRGWEDSLL